MKTDNQKYRDEHDRIYSKLKTDKSAETALSTCVSTPVSIQLMSKPALIKHIQELNKISIDRGCLLSDLETRLRTAQRDRDRYKKELVQVAKGLKKLQRDV